MPALDAQNAVVSTILEVRTLLDELLDEAAAIKPVDSTAKVSSNIEPPLKGTDFSDIKGRVAQASSSGTAEPDAANEDSSNEDQKARQFSVIEVAARDIFGELVVGLP
jgi:hypothetical protein